MFLRWQNFDLAEEIAHLKQEGTYLVMVNTVEIQKKKRCTCFQGGTMLG